MRHAIKLLHSADVLVIEAIAASVALVVFSACSVDLPEPKNCDCPPPCMVKIIHTSGFSDLGRVIEIKDYDSGEQYKYDDWNPGKGGPMPSNPEYFSVPCCKRLTVNVTYFAGCVPGSPLFGEAQYIYTTDISPQECTTEVESEPELFFSDCP